jgi:hypothetical protein
MDSGLRRNDVDDGCVAWVPATGGWSGCWCAADNQFVGAAQKGAAEFGVELGEFEPGFGHLEPSRGPLQ